jgi:hypothetical protein
LRAFDGVDRTMLPMKDSPAAKAILTPGARKTIAPREKT